MFVGCLSSQRNENTQWFSNSFYSAIQNSTQQPNGIHTYVDLHPDSTLPSPAACARHSGVSHELLAVSLSSHLVDQALSVPGNVTPATTSSPVADMLPEKWSPAMCGIPQKPRMAGGDHLELLKSL